MKQKVYDQVVKVIAKEPFDFTAVLNKLSGKFPEESAETLRSIIGQELTKRVQKNFSSIYRNPSRRTEIYERYLECLKNLEKPGIILRIAKDYDFSPALVGKIILEEWVCREQGDETGVTKSQIGRLMKDTTLIDDRDLAYEVQLSIVRDDMYGNLAEGIKHTIGQEREQLLKRLLKSANIPFLDENDLRHKGYDKTPDVKLEVPIAVNGHIVNWIESKALFGDYENHQGYLKDQLRSYWNRFGPGLVIYWFDYIEELNGQDKDIILASDFPSPDSITLFDPAEALEEEFAEEQ